LINQLYFQNPQRINRLLLLIKGKLIISFLFKILNWPCLGGKPPFFGHILAAQGGSKPPRWAQNVFGGDSGYGNVGGVISTLCASAGLESFRVAPKSQ
jgi:hypothetical protein